MVPSPSEPPIATTPTAAPPAPAALAEAVAAWAEPLTRYATRIVGDRERARDVVQDTFLRLHESGDAIPPAALKSWLFRVCRNRALDVLRHERRSVSLETAGEPLVEPRGERTLVLAELAQLLDDLPDDKREVMALRYRDGHSYRQISEQTGLTVSHVGTILHQATRTLKGRVAMGASLLLVVLVAAFWPTPEATIAERALPEVLDRAAAPSSPLPLELRPDEAVVEGPRALPSGTSEPSNGGAPPIERPKLPEKRHSFDGDEPAPR